MKPPNLVVDTNILVHAAQNERSDSARLLNWIMLGNADVLLDARILAEYQRVVRIPRLEIDSEFGRIICGYFHKVGIDTPAMRGGTAFGNAGRKAFRTRVNMDMSTSRKAACQRTSVSSGGGCG